MPDLHRFPAAPESDRRTISRRRLLGGLVGVGAAMLIPIGARREAVATSQADPTSIIAMSLHHNAFHDERVRQAIPHAIDWAGARFVALGDAAVRNAEGTVPYPHDLNRAEALLREAGWSQHDATWHVPDGSEARFDLEFPTDSSGIAAAAQFIARNLIDFGIVVDPRMSTCMGSAAGKGQGAQISFWESGGSRVHRSAVHHPDP